MGFGKNKHLSAPRPKKKKVEARAEAIEASCENENPQETGGDNILRKPHLPAHAPLPPSLARQVEAAGG